MYDVIRDTGKHTQEKTPPFFGGKIDGTQFAQLLVLYSCCCFFGRWVSTHTFSNGRSRYDIRYVHIITYNIMPGTLWWPLFWLEFRPCFRGLIFKTWGHYGSRYTIYLPRWWFQIFLIFTPTWGRFPVWRAYFSNGLKPPTSYILHTFSQTSQLPIPHFSFRQLARASPASPVMLQEPGIPGCQGCHHWVFRFKKALKRVDILNVYY